MLKLAESRSPADQELWRSFKAGTAAPGAVAKEFDVAKALEKMGARVDQLMLADPGIKSRESAIAKIAASPLESDRRLWDRYKASGAALPSSSPAAVGKAADKAADEALIQAIMTRLGCSRERAAGLALEVRAAA
jgi:hypothetical protein